MKAEGIEYERADGAARGGHLAEAARGAARGDLRDLRRVAAVGARLRAVAQVGRARPVRAGHELLGVRRVLPARAQRGPRAALPERRVSRRAADDSRVGAHRASCATSSSGSASSCGRSTRACSTSGRRSRTRIAWPRDIRRRPSLPPTPRSVLTNRRAFLVLVRNELWRRVQPGRARPRRRARGTGLRGRLGARRSTATSPSTTRSGTGPDARSAARVIVDEAPTGQPGRWLVRQILDDPAGDHDWAIRAEVDLAASEEQGIAVVRVLGMDRL